MLKVARQKSADKKSADFHDTRRIFLSAYVGGYCRQKLVVSHSLTVTVVIHANRIAFTFNHLSHLMSEPFRSWGLWLKPTTIPACSVHRYRATRASVHVVQLLEDSIIIS